MTTHSSIENPALAASATPSVQDVRYRLAMAGEFFVAAQLQRIWLSASVSYGNAKQADIVVLSRDSTRAVVVEVKTSGQGEWRIGNHVPKPTGQPWVFVYLAENRISPPRYFVLLQSELHAIKKPAEDAYKQAYFERTGQVWDESKRGWAAVSLIELEAFENNWASIEDAMAAVPPPL